MIKSFLRHAASSVRTDWFTVTATVVAAVIITGRSRVATPLSTASRTFMPSSRSSLK